MDRRRVSELSMTQRGELSQLSGGAEPVHLFLDSRPWPFVCCSHLGNSGDSVIDPLDLYISETTVRYYVTIKHLRVRARGDITCKVEV